ncbi:response regulator transcription factor [Treponema pectinovorum]|uniref:response regulator transcription factor n=1 Tax=Treponema pectinovorum TaxID=164 RepID=UPI0011C96AFF|nr:response regulator transcription factor [Treponema pectinovorum]
MNSKILVIEDIPEMAELVSMYLTKSGMQVDSVGSAEDAFTYIDRQMPDLIILDLNLPGMSGFEFLTKFRKEYNSSLPVIIVSARDADEDIINGLGDGADEFVTKPYSPKVLVARVEAIIRRQAKVTAAAEASYDFGPYTVLLNSCVLKKGPEKIPLSTKEYEVLEFLISHEGETLGPERIYNEVWKAQYGDITAVAVYVQRLRKKIEDDHSNPKYIKTVFGMGYKFEKGSN